VTREGGLTAFCIATSGIAAGVAASPPSLVRRITSRPVAGYSHPHRVRDGMRLAEPGAAPRNLREVRISITTNTLRAPNTMRL